MSPKALAEAITPRPSVFDPSVRDTVYDIGRLNDIDPNQFFAENYVTTGMKQLLSEAFTRLEGVSENASGIFLLSQSMGGGKTHNLLALGLLAKHPKMRQQVIGRFHDLAPLGAVRVVAINGRDPDTKFGLWGAIATQLNKREVFADLYSPLEAPGQQRWVELLQGQPTLILLDELPPYFTALQAVQIGATTLDVITTVALANLLVAVNSGELPNVCLVMTDLRASAYEEGSARISNALADMEQEANRSAQRIDPVRLNTDELYHVLRTRLFEQMPENDDIAAVADAYARAVDEAKKTDQTTYSPEAMRAGIESSYPFHPAIRDLYARFRENPGFQQTRALLRLMRAVVANLWESGGANQHFLIAAQNLDLHDDNILGEVKKINRTLDVAIAHDIADEQRTAVAETIDGPAGRDAQEAATLLFLSSLGNVPDAIKGLDRGTVMAYLAGPRRDLGGLRAALDRLQLEAWYLHATGTGLLEFKDTRNLNAMLDDYARGMSATDREIEVRERLESIFAPNLKHQFGATSVLEPLDPSKITQDIVTLIVFRPEPDAKAEIERFWENLQFKNRVVFLTGNPAAYERAKEHAASLRAIKAIIADLRQNYRDGDPQLEDAKSIQSRIEERFYLACRETFQTLLYPSGRGLTTLELSPQYAANQYNGEALVADALMNAYKFRADAVVDPESMRRSIDNKLWPGEAKEAVWNDIKRRAATEPSWVFTHPRALDEIKDALIREDKWRESAPGFVERGPFQPPPPSVTVQLMGRDPQTGEATIRVTARHADRVLRLRENGGGYAPVEDFTFKTKDLSLAFMPANTAGEPLLTEPIRWTNEIDVKHKFFQAGDEQRCALQAVPAGAIRYTVDGSSPETSGSPYDEPFLVPKDAKFILAVAEGSGVKSPVKRIEVTARNGPVILDRDKPATWNHTLKCDATGESFALIDQLAKYGAWPGGLRLMVSRDDDWVDLFASDHFFQDPARVREQATLLTTILPGSNLTLDVAAVEVARGQALYDLVADLKLTLVADEVVQE